ncbi:dihydroneopterin triphosphate diphosphatase [Corallincola platygyrae]|uniref:Dihydroneopterin triphosphate diphosphatase n=1 Tax=Corallincola platygyrae TaxID=1193278 RepID=A0ABW4XSP1_9GAMM
MYKRPESVLVVIYREDFRVLLMRRSFPDDFWQSVTGSLEHQEQPLAAAIREVHEETGVEPGLVGASIVDVNTQVRYPLYPEWKQRYAPDVNENLEHWFFLKVPQNTVIRLCEGEHQEYVWLTFAEALAQVSSESNRDAIVQLAEKLELHAN